MFHPPQAAIGLALLPLAWAATERARVERGGAPGPSRETDEDLARYFPPGWNRDTVPSWPQLAAPGARRVTFRWRRSDFGVLLRSAARRMRGLVPGFLRH